MKSANQIGSPDEMIFLMGLPAAGKSTIAKSRYAKTHSFIDPDAIKESHPEYNPAEAFKLHRWSKLEEEKQFQRALFSGGAYIVDGTGTNSDAMVRKMTQAKAAGFSVKLLYVKCTLQTSLRRAAKRTRQVPSEVIEEKALNIATSFEIVAPYADSIEVVNNDSDRV